MSQMSLGLLTGTRRLGSTKSRDTKTTVWLQAAQAALAGEPRDHEGIEFEQDIEDMFYGARQFCIRDLNGYQLYFIQSAER
jgi:hypothetical protein